MDAEQSPVEAAGVMCVAEVVDNEEGREPLRGDCRQRDARDVELEADYEEEV